MIDSTLQPRLDVGPLAEFDVVGLWLRTVASRGRAHIAAQYERSLRPCAGRFAATHGIRRGTDSNV